MTPLRDDSRPRARPGVAERIIDGEALLVNAEGGEILVLNETGALVWQLLDGENDVAAIVQRVVESHDVGSETAREDVLEFLAALDQRGALVLP